MATNSGRQSNALAVRGGRNTHAELERVVKFLNEQTRDNLEVLAVEVKQYPGQFGDALVSRVIGQVDTPRSGTVREAAGSEVDVMNF